MTPRIGDDVCYSALLNSACVVRVKVVAVRERTALVQYADGHIDEVLLTRLSEVPASWNEPQASIVVSLDRLKTELGNPIEFDRLAKKRGLRLTDLDELRLRQFEAREHLVRRLIGLVEDCLEPGHPVFDAWRDVTDHEMNNGAPLPKIEHVEASDERF